MGPWTLTPVVMQKARNKSDPNFTVSTDPSDPGKGWNLFHKCDLLASDVVGVGVQPLVETGPACDPVLGGNHFVLIAIVNLRTVKWSAVRDFVKARGSVKILLADSLTPASRVAKAQIARMVDAIRQMLAWNAAMQLGVSYAQTLKIAKKIPMVEVRHNTQMATAQPAPARTEVAACRWWSRSNLVES